MSQKNILYLYSFILISNILEDNVIKILRIDSCFRNLYIFLFQLEEIQRAIYVSRLLPAIPP